MSLNFEDWKKDFLTDAEQMGLLKIHPEGKQLGDNEWWQKPERGLAGEVIDLEAIYQEYLNDDTFEESSEDEDMDDIEAEWGEHDSVDAEKAAEITWYSENMDDLVRELFANPKKIEIMENGKEKERGHVLDDNEKKSITAIINTGLSPDKLYKLLNSINGSANSGFKYPVAFGISIMHRYAPQEKKEIIEAVRQYIQNHQGGFFFSKKKTRKKRQKKTRKKKKKKKQTRKKKEKKTRKKKDIKFTDTGYPYRNISNREAIDDFLALKKIVQGTINPRSISGNKTVDWGTEKARRKTKYRNKSFIEMWDNEERRKKMLKFAKRLKKQRPKSSIYSSIRSAIDLQWGSVNTMRAAAAAQMYKKYGATRVLDFTAGWGARMIAAMALDIDYIGIDTNKSLIPGYNKIIKLLKPYTKSKVKMIWKEAQKVDYSKLGKYDYVFTSPPYEYLEAYENMTNYENKGSKIKQPSSSQKIKIDDSEKFYDEFLVPTLEKAYKHLPKNKFICLNMPDIMYDKIKTRWPEKLTKKETYQIIKRTGGPVGKDRRGKELIFCWKKRKK
jgi:hypothetical protein